MIRILLISITLKAILIPSVIEDNKIRRYLQIRQRNMPVNYLGIDKYKHLSIMNENSLSDNAYIIKVEDLNLKMPLYEIYIDKMSICNRTDDIVDVCTGDNGENFRWEIFFVDRKGYMILSRKNGNKCLTAEKNVLKLKKCSSTNENQYWDIGEDTKVPSFESEKEKYIPGELYTSENPNFFSIMYQNAKNFLNNLNV
ncbi:hypothetical protein H312_01122 [Anncaliia algerae PRA339]|uniref:Uncharacterized protein n=1 Tax=Anncaliia algerae PRA339 TaxID=1288291 RepID=A0A059F2N2_9MICR|nr:hypothetical protein H312_01122 [Anncaliia algerae PRA339]